MGQSQKVPPKALQSDNILIADSFFWEGIILKNYNK